MQQHYPSIKNSIGLILRLFLFAVLLTIPFLIIRIFLNNDDQYTTLTAYLVTIPVVLAEIWLIGFAIRKIKTTESFLLSDQLRFRAYHFAPFALLSILALDFLLQPIEQLIPVSSSFEQIFHQLMSHKILAALHIILLGPILEEIIFRGIILRGFLKNYHPVKAIILSSLLFGIIHLNLSQLVTAFVIGCFIGFIYWKTRSLFLCILIHIVNNALAFAFIWKFGFNISPDQLINNTAVYLILYMAAALLFSFSLFQIYKNSDRKTEESF